jgi:hypothetical protein
MKVFSSAMICRSALMVYRLSFIVCRSSLARQPAPGLAEIQIAAGGNPE